MFPSIFSNRSRARCEHGHLSSMSARPVLHLAAGYPRRDVRDLLDFSAPSGIVVQCRGRGREVGALIGLRGLLRPGARLEVFSTGRSCDMPHGRRLVTRQSPRTVARCSGAMPARRAASERLVTRPRSCPGACRPCLGLPLAMLRLLADGDRARALGFPSRSAASVSASRRRVITTASVSGPTSYRVAVSDRSRLRREGQLLDEELATSAACQTPRQQHTRARSRARGVVCRSSRVPSPSPRHAPTMVSFKAHGCSWILEHECFYPAFSPSRIPGDALRRLTSPCRRSR